MDRKKETLEIELEYNATKRKLEVYGEKISERIYMKNNRELSASCVVIRNDKVLLVKHTYGVTKGKYLIPGAFSEDGDMVYFQS